MGFQHPAPHATRLMQYFRVKDINPVSSLNFFRNEGFSYKRSELQTHLPAERNYPGFINRIRYY